MNELTEYKHVHDYWEAEAKRLRAENEALRKRIADLEAPIEAIEDLHKRLADLEAKWRNMVLALGE
jgi:prefoldin subunit 5